MTDMKTVNYNLNLDKYVLSTFILSRIFLDQNKFLD